MDVESLLYSLDRNELGQIVETLPKVYVNRGWELPATLGGVAIVHETEEPDETSGTSQEVWRELTSEQHEKATRLINAMAEKFGVKLEDFSVLRTETEDGQEEFTVAYTAGNGIRMGSWNKIMSNRYTKDFTVEIDGVKFDTRKGMTRGVYKAMVDQAKANKQPLPDSTQHSGQNDELITWTLLTGDLADELDVHVPVTYVVQGGHVYGFWDYREDDIESVRFRPAVVIE